MTPTYQTEEHMEPEQVPLQDILHAVDDAEWPAEKGELAEHAREQEAPEPVERALRKLPQHRYEGKADVAEAYQEHHASVGDGSSSIRRSGQQESARHPQGEATPEPADEPEAGGPGAGARGGTAPSREGARSPRTEEGENADVQGPEEGNARSRNTGSARLRDVDRGRRQPAEGRSEEREG